MSKYLLPILFLSASALAKPTLHIAYSANRQGEIEPCGCQVHQTGGINRVQALLEDEKKAHPSDPTFFVDSGDSFFSAANLNPNRKPAELARAKIIAEAYRTLGVDVMVPGERDLADGLDTLKSLGETAGITFVGGPFEPFHVFQKGDLKIAVAGLVDEKTFQTAWKEMLPKIKEAKPDVVIVLSHLGLPSDRVLAEIGGMDLIFGAHSLDVLTDPAHVGKIAIHQPQNEGAQLGLVDYQPDDSTKTAHRLIDLTKEYDRENSVAALMKKYKEQVRKLAVESSGKVETKTGRAYVANSLTCRGCHAKQHDFWESTKHASAYLVLYAKNQHFDQECIGCHSLGFEQAGGFKSVATPLELEPKEIRKKGSPTFVETMMKKIFEADPKKGALDSRTDPERFATLKKRYHEEVRALEESGRIKRLYIGVQCEHCHGNREGHPSPKVATIKKVSENSCRACHRPPNAPDFTPDMIAKVACPLSPGH